MKASAVNSKTHFSCFDSPASDERALREVFDRIASFTIGAEEEYFLVDPESYELTPAAEFALARGDGDGRIAAELRAAQIEAITPVCITVPELKRELTSIRSLLAAGLADSAFLVAAGTHPLALAPGAVTPRPRYRRLVAENPWAGNQVLTCGLHVHVAVGGAERALAVYNALRSYLPEIIALAANAPIFRGEDSGLATVRPKLNQVWPRAGVPPAFASWRDGRRLYALGAGGRRDAGRQPPVVGPAAPAEVRHDRDPGGRRPDAPRGLRDRGCARAEPRLRPRRPATTRASRFPSIQASGSSRTRGSPPVTA